MATRLGWLPRPLTGRTRRPRGASLPPALLAAVRPHRAALEQLHVTRNHRHRTIEPLMEAADDFIEGAQAFPGTQLSMLGHAAWDCRRKSAGHLVCPWLELGPPMCRCDRDLGWKRRVSPSRGRFGRLLRVHAVWRAVTLGALTAGVGENDEDLKEMVGTTKKSAHSWSFTWLSRMASLGRGGLLVRACTSVPWTCSPRSAHEARGPQPRFAADIASDEVLDLLDHRGP